MTTLWLSAVVATALTGLSVAIPSASAQDAGNGYGPPPYTDNAYGPPSDYGDAYANSPECNPANYPPDQAIPPACLPQAYCDQYGCPDDFYDMPVWYGPVFYEGIWFAGPVYYRAWHGQRQYWIHGGWHYDTWRGLHPSWWKAGHYHTGPALGRAYYRNHSAGGATSIRVWRGTQATTYYDSGDGNYVSSEIAGSGAIPKGALRPTAGGGPNPQAALQPTGSANFNAQRPPQQRALRYHYRGGHIQVPPSNNGSMSSGRGGYYSGRR